MRRNPVKDARAHRAVEMMAVYGDKYPGVIKEDVVTAQIVDLLCYCGAVGDDFDQRLKDAQREFRGPRIIATDHQAPRIYPRMIRLCSRFDSVLFTPKISEIPSYCNYSRSPSDN